MKDLFKSKFLETMAGKLTAILSFAVLLVVILALLGTQIEDRWLPLVYIVAIVAMVIFAYEIFVNNKSVNQQTDKQDGDKSKEDIKQVMLDSQKDVSRPYRPTISIPDAENIYLFEVIQEYTPLSLSVLDAHSGDIKGRLALEDIYISLNTTTQIEIRELVKNRQLTSNEILDINFGHNSVPLPALKALEIAPDRRMVLLGRPGTGKSTFIRYLALQMAKLLTNTKEEALEGWTGQLLLPIVISLGRFAEEIPLNTKRGTVELLESFIISMLERNNRMKDFAPFVLEALRDKGGMFLFDGLDEVANLDLRPIVVQAVESFIALYQRNHKSCFLVTCRTYSYEDERWKLTAWPVYELSLFTPQQIDQFIETWYKLHSILEPKRKNEFEEKQSKLLEAIQPDNPRRLFEIASIPIILTVMAVVHASYELPDSRALVYERCVEILLEKWQLARSIQGSEGTRGILSEMNVPASQIYSALYEIAYEAHKGFNLKDKEGEMATSLITEGLVLQVLHDQIGDHDKEKVFLEYCRKANGLLMLRGTVIPSGSSQPRRVYTLPHLTFEEYLASRFIKKLGAGYARQLFDENKDRWWETIKFMAEFLCFSNDADRDAMNGLLEAFSLPFPEKPTNLDWHALWLAGELLRYYQRRFSAKRSVYEPEIIRNLQSLVNSSALSVKDRADVADVLDQLWQPEDLHKFVFISDFSISRYPVTNSQYERFLKSDFGNRKYWIDFPIFDKKCQRVKGDLGGESWEWIKNELQDSNNHVQDGVLLPRYWHDPLFGVSRRNAPVVGISWYEANAYCKWLCNNWETLEEGRQGLAKPNLIRLPTENEWTFAAGGEESVKHHAFGEAIDAKEIVRYANTNESGINRTTPVWMYPKGESPSHVMDMSGNVWEWQANYSGNEFEGEKAFGLRGGSWTFNGNLALTSSRNNDRPSYRYFSTGFRIILPQIM